MLSGPILRRYPVLPNPEESPGVVGRGGSGDSSEASNDADYDRADLASQNDAERRRRAGPPTP